MNTPNESEWTAAELEVKNSLSIADSLYKKRYYSVEDTITARNALVTTLQTIDEFEGSDDRFFMVQLNEMRNNIVRWLEDTEALLEGGNTSERRAA